MLSHCPGDFPGVIVACVGHPWNWSGCLACIIRLMLIRDAGYRCFNQLVELSHFLSGGRVWHTFDNLGTIGERFHDFVIMRDCRVRDCFVLELHCVTEALAFGGLNVTSVCTIMLR